MVTYSVRDAIKVPGLISLARLPLAVAFWRSGGKPRRALALFALAGASDVIDGWFARHFHEETPTGAVLDAFMDKFFILAVVATLVSNRKLTARDALLLGIRDLGELPLALGVVAHDRTRSASRHANAAGKLATVLQFASLIAILRRTAHKDLWILATSVCGAVAVATYWAREKRSEQAP